MSRRCMACSLALDALWIQVGFERKGGSTLLVHISCRSYAICCSISSALLFVFGDLTDAPQFSHAEAVTSGRFRSFQYFQADLPATGRLFSRKGIQTASNAARRLSIITAFPSLACEGIIMKEIARSHLSPCSGQFAELIQLQVGLAHTPPQPPAYLLTCTHPATKQPSCLHTSIHAHLLFYLSYLLTLLFTFRPVPTKFYLSTSHYPSYRPANSPSVLAARPTASMAFSPPSHAGLLAGGSKYPHLFHVTDWLPTIVAAAGGSLSTLGNQVPELWHGGAKAV
eukprot:347138-Pleurochrysis_carterae.AAC.4